MALIGRLPALPTTWLIFGTLLNLSLFSLLICKMGIKEDPTLFGFCED